MDQIIWNSATYEEYIRALQRMRRRLEEEINLLSAESRRMRSNGAEADETMRRILSKLDKTIRRLTRLNDRVIKLYRALNSSADIFSSAENKVGSMAAGLLYGKVMRGIESGKAGASYISMGTSLSSTPVTADWLAAML